MLSTPSIRGLPAPRPRLHAFRITGTVTQDDMAAMGERIVEVFEASDETVDMLLTFDGCAGSETFANLSWQAIESRTRALWSEDRSRVASAPERAAAMIEAMLVRPRPIRRRRRLGPPWGCGRPGPERFSAASRADRVGTIR